MRKYGRIASLVIVFIVLMMFSLTTIQLYAKETIYSAGDWLKYRIYTKAEFINMTSECDFTVRINLEKIEGTSVTLSSTVESVKKRDNLCTAMISSFNSKATVDVEQLDPRRGSLLVDPKYTGEYDINGIKVTYNKGVLTKLVGKTTSMGIDLSINIELIDTNIAELKSAPIISIALAISIILAVVGVSIAIVIIIVLKHAKRTTTATPTTPPKQLYTTI